METITPEQEIEQQLTLELQKLKKAVAYIEEAKEAANTSAKHLAAMNIKYEQMKIYNIDFQAAINTIEDKLEKKISSANKSQVKSIHAINGKVEYLDSAFRNEFTMLRKSYKKFKLISYVSLVVSLFSLISLILILVGAINDL